MKRQILKSLSTLCVSAMALFATSSLVVSCYDDGALWDAVEDVQNDVKDLQAKLEALTSKVDALYTLKFQVTAANELQYSFDGGTTWVSTGVDLTEGCDDVSLVDNGDSVTITVGEQSFTIEKPEEIVFEIRAGKVYFESEGEQTIAIKSSGIEDVTVMSVPKGWEAKIDVDGMLVVTAPDYADTEWSYDEDWNEIPPVADWEGVIKVHACSVEGKCMVGKLPVEVSETPIVVKAYAGKYMVTAVNGRWSTVYYGISPRETYEADAKVLLTALENHEYEVLDGWKYVAAPTSEGKIADVLGYEPKVGEEYVVWAIDEYSSSYTVSDLVLAFYSPVNVEAVEDVEKKTAYDVYVDIKVQGADSYYAYAVPNTGADFDLEYQKEQMTQVGGYWYPAKLHTESYSGSLYSVAEGTMGSAFGMGAPEQDCYLLVLPVDGRPAEEYTVEDVLDFKFTTAALSAGGTMNVKAERVYEYTNDYGELAEIDKYTELAVKVEPASDAKWMYFYFNWLTPEDYQDLSVADEDLVSYLSSDVWAKNSPSDATFPYVSLQDVQPGETMWFVAFFVDEAGKYGELVKMELTSDVLAKSDIAFSDDLKTNLDENDALVNNMTFEIALATDVAASKYKYIWVDEDDYRYSQYSTKTDAEMSDIIYFAETEGYGVIAKEVLASDLVDGKLAIEGHEYNKAYYLAVLPYDEEGKPGKSAYVLDYECVFEISSVESDPAKFVSEPKISFSIPMMMDGEYGESYYWHDSNYGNYQYSVSYTVTPVAGTQVATLIVEPETASEYGYDHEMSDLLKATGLWTKNINGQSYYINVFEEEGTTDPRSFYIYEDAPVVPYILVSWIDADGNYYYKEVSLEKEFAIMYANMRHAFYEEVDETVTTTPDGSQWTFFWDDFGTDMCLDFGVMQEGKFAVAADVVSQGAPEGTPFQLFNVIEYDIVPLDETCGSIVGISYDIAGEKISQYYPYFNLTDTSCDFSFENLLGTFASCKKATTPIAIDGGGIAM